MLHELLNQYRPVPLIGEVNPLDKPARFYMNLRDKAFCRFPAQKDIEYAEMIAISLLESDAEREIVKIPGCRADGLVFRDSAGQEILVFDDFIIATTEDRMYGTTYYLRVPFSNQ